MKVLAFASLFLTLSAQASTFDCFSHEEMGPVYSMKIGKSRMTADAEGHQFLARSVKVTEYGQNVLVGDAVGTANARTMDLTFLEGGDMAMGSLTAKKYMAGRLAGTLSLAGKGKIDVSCVVKK